MKEHRESFGCVCFAKRQATQYKRFLHKFKTLTKAVCGITTQFPFIFMLLILICPLILFLADFTLHVGVAMTYQTLKGANMISKESLSVVFRIQNQTGTWVIQQSIWLLSHTEVSNLCAYIAVERLQEDEKNQTFTD